MKKLALPFRMMESPLHDRLSTKDIDFLSQHVECLQFDKKEQVYESVHKCNFVYLLAKGSIKLTNILDEGKEMIKYIVQPGELFGEWALISDEPKEELAIAVRDNVQVWKIPVNALIQVFNNNAIASLYVTSVIQEKLNNIERRLGNFIAKNARSRIVDFIKYNAETRGKQIGYEILINHKLTHQDIANITGTSRQTVTSVLNDLKRLNLIYFNGMGILVRDLARLA